MQIICLFALYALIFNIILFGQNNFIIHVLLFLIHILLLKFSFQIYHVLL